MAEHDFYLCKAAIEKVIVLDWYGGPHHVPVATYFDHKYDTTAAGEEEEEETAAVEPQRRHTDAGGLRFPTALHLSSSKAAATTPKSGKQIRIHVDQATNDVVIDM